MSRAVAVETSHEDVIHDAQLDYYGKRLATCSSDRSIRVFDVHAPGAHAMTSQIRGHDGPVWQVAWAHPKFGSLLASCSYDSRLCVWKEQAANNWAKIYEFSRPDSSINALQFAPHAFGLALACGAADGSVSILTRKADNTWDAQTFMAHKGGVNSVSWGPDVKSGSLLAQQSAAGGAVKYDRKLLTGGCDNQIRMWRLAEETGQWLEVRAFGEANEAAHGDWVRDAQFAPSMGLPSGTLASCSEDKTVCIWTEDAATGLWRKARVLRFDAKVYKLSWSLMGNILAVAQGDNQVSLWKESIDGEWKSLSQQQAAALTQAQPAVPPSPAHMQQPPQQQQQQPQQQAQVGGMAHAGAAEYYAQAGMAPQAQQPMAPQHSPMQHMPPQQPAGHYAPQAHAQGQYAQPQYYQPQQPQYGHAPTNF